MDERSAGQTTRDGREASPAELRRRLSSAGPDYLRGALGNPALDRSELRLLLRNRCVPGDQLEKLAGDRRWVRHHAIRRDLALHPNTPPATARRLLSALFWQDWLDVVNAAGVQAGVRRQAERHLVASLDRLGSGERITLARRAPRRLFGALAADGEPRVLGALLGNTRWTGEDARRLAAREDARPELLRRLAAHPDWGSRRSVRLALARNGSTSHPEALRVVRGLDASDLETLLEDATAPRLVRVAAARRLRPDDPPDRPGDDA